MLENFTQVLVKSPLFEGVNREELPAMLDCLQPREASYQKGAYITTAGGPLGGVGVILAGKAAVIKESAGGVRVVMTM
jgi:signal-transduction protein with cAMP-binding, CBS, and nucleotidyltransferase domain